MFKYGQHHSYLSTGVSVQIILGYLLSVYIGNHISFLCA